MKIRTGFVSNSSSSSFCIYGINKSEKEIKEALLSKGFATEEDLVDGVSEYFYNFTYQCKEQRGTLTEEEKAEDAERIFRKADGWLFESNPYDSNYSYLGLPWSFIKDDETGAQFKEKIEGKMKQLFGEDVKCATYEECWQEG
jgi:hypothetical protein